jgi:hypothetical protein
MGFRVAARMRWSLPTSGDARAWID